jgi:hypothetical protein
VARGKNHKGDITNAASHKGVKKKKKKREREREEMHYENMYQTQGRRRDEINSRRPYYGSRVHQQG